MSVVTNIVDLVCNVVPSWNILMVEAKDTVGKFNEQAIQEMNKAQEVVDDRDDISVNLYNEIVRICDGDTRSIEVLTAKALATEKWIKYVIYYLTDPSAVKITCDKESAELVNGIANFFAPDLGPIYKEEKSANLDKFDAKKLRTDKVKFILYKDELAERFNTEMVEKAKAKFTPEPEEENHEVVNSEETKTILERTGRFDDQGYFHPIFTKSKEDVKKEIEDKPMKPDNMPQDKCDKFNNRLAKFIGNRKHYYSLDNVGNTYLNIVDGDCMVSSYMVDDGTIMGGESLSVLGNYMTIDGRMDTIFVNIDKHPDIVSRILSPALYVMTPQEVMEVNSKLFSDGRIYRSIDFSNTSFIDTGDMTRLIDKALSAVVSLNDQDARLKFENFIDSDHFTLVSDLNCKSTLPGVTSTNIVNGLKFIVDGNTITKILGGNGTKYQF